MTGCSLNSGFRFHFLSSFPSKANSLGLSNSTRHSAPTPWSQRNHRDALYIASTGSLSTCGEFTSLHAAPRRLSSFAELLSGNESVHFHPFKGENTMAAPNLYWGYIAPQWGVLIAASNRHQKWCEWFFSFPIVPKETTGSTMVIREKADHR